MAVLCVKSVLIFRSPNSKTRSTILCSISSISPSKALSLTIDFISSSLIILSEVFFIPNTFNKTLLEVVSNNTNGEVILDKISIGFASKVIIRSGKVMAILFGKSSPNKIER